MPKKTKKLKIRSAQRKIQTPFVYQANQKQKYIHSHSIEENISPLQNNPNNISLPISDDELRINSFFRQDLKKSLILILGIITLEIFFYFASMSTALKGLLPF